MWGQVFNPPITHISARGVAALLLLLQTLLQTLAFERKTHRVPGARWLAGLAELVSCEFSQRPYLSEWGGEWSRKIPDPTKHMHMHPKHTHTPTHVNMQNYSGPPLEQRSPSAPLIIVSSTKAILSMKGSALIFLVADPRNRQPTHTAMKIILSRKMAFGTHKNKQTTRSPDDCRRTSLLENNMGRWTFETGNSKPGGHLKQLWSKWDQLKPIYKGFHHTGYYFTENGKINCTSTSFFIPCNYTRPYIFFLREKCQQLCILFVI